MQRPEDGEDHVRVAPGDDGEWHEEPQQVEYDSIGDVVGKLLIYGIIPTVLVLLAHVTVATIAITHSVPSLGKAEDGARQGKHHDPDEHACALHRPLGLQRDGLHWVADAQVSVHGDAGEEEDGAVEVEVEEEADQAAHEVAEHPAVAHDIAGDEEWQRQAVHEVCGGQVDHVDEGGVPALGTSEGAVEDDGVEGDAEEEGERVADGEEDVLVGFVNAAGWGRGDGGRRDRGRRGGVEESMEEDVQVVDARSCCCATSGGHC